MPPKANLGEKLQVKCVNKKPHGGEVMSAALFFSLKNEFCSSTVSANVD